MTGAVALLFCLIVLAGAYLIKRVGPVVVTQFVGPVLTLAMGLAVGAGARGCVHGDHEYWTGYAMQVSKKDPWTEVKTTTDAKGRPTVTVIHHPAEYWVTDTNDLRVSVDDDQYQALARRFGHSPSRFGFLGAEHHYPWNKDPATAEVVTTRHWFKNLPAHSDSVFSFNPPTDREAKAEGLYAWDTFSRPYNSRCCYGWDDGSVEDALMRLNADYGKAYQVRVHLLVFRDKPVDTYFRQQAYWRGGKKNELNVCVGLDAQDKPDWCQVMSWSDRELFKAEVQDFICQQPKFDPHKLVGFLREKVPSGWKRREFSEFDYIRTRTPMWAYAVAAVLGVIGGVLTIAASHFKN